MKKLFFTLIAIVATSLASFSQTSLHDAYLSLKDIPGMKVKNDQAVQVNGIANINQARTASAVTDKNADRLRGQFNEVIESLPGNEIIINSNTASDFATILAEPADYHLYNVLILQGDALTGLFSATYGTATAEGVEAMIADRSLLESNDLVLTPVATAEGALITMTE